MYGKGIFAIDGRNHTGRRSFLLLTDLGTEIIRLGFALYHQFWGETLDTDVYDNVWHIH